jgi:O-antigen ligase
MILAFAAGHALARAGLVLDALLAAAALLAGGGARRAAVAGALVLTPVLLLAELWKSTQLEHLRHHHLEAAAGVVAALAVLAAVTVILRGRPRLLALAAVVALPFRFSVIAGGTGGILLILYAVIGGGAIGLVLWDGGDGAAEPRAGGLERALALFVVLYALQALYTPSASLAKAVEDVGFFLVPFALLFVLLRRVPWDRALVVRCALALVVLALAFVAVGAVEFASERLIFNTALNSNQRFFRVNSLFYDPNIFGRFLVVAMLVLLAAMFAWRDRRRLAAGAAVLAVLWLGLLGTLSQSSMLALLAGLAVIAAALISLRVTAIACAVLVAAGVAFAVADSGRLHLSFADTSAANNATSFRASLVKGGFDLFTERPLEGFGSGSFSCEFLRRNGKPCSDTHDTSDSHTIPITVAAEQGLIGLAAYVLLLVAAFWRLAAGGVRGSPARVALLAAFAALVVHTWAYADFLEDPITWTLLALGSALAVAGAARAAPDPEPGAVDPRAT